MPQCPVAENWAFHKTMQRTRKDSNFDAYMGKNTLTQSHTIAFFVDVEQWNWCSRMVRQAAREKKKRKGEKVQFDVQILFSIRKIRVFLEIRESIVFQRECELG